MIKALKNVFIFICVSFFLLSMAGLALSAIDRSKKNETYKELELFADALAYIQVQYVDETKAKDLIYGALSGMINSLDPHSQFLSPEEYEGLKVETEGKFGGIGVEITIKDDFVTVITPIEGTPAWDAGLKTGDRIVKIDDTVARNIMLGEVVKKLRGKPGTEVNIVVWREKEGKLYYHKIKRALIEVKDIKESRILEDDIAYLKLVEFTEGTPKELDRAVKDLKDKGAKALVLDLRNNPGGLLDKAVEVAERFLPKGALIVSIKGRDPKQDAEYKADSRSPEVDMPIVLLVNEGSASGSEIVAGAFKDNRRAIILGQKTFGKGSVQTVLPLRDGSALKLTSSRYYTPKGESIHDKGVVPDIVVAQAGFIDEKLKDDKSAMTEELDKIFEDVDKEKPKEEAVLQEMYAKDPQLARAVDLIKSIRIYKGLHPQTSSTGNE
ncbi:MAG TPA: peptidase S41 [Candidatus Omnitrophica bacterium]|nr:peptidase S41 [Candidatus Omnitrophota bacterium]